MTALDFLSFSGCLIAGAYRTNLRWRGVWSQASTVWLIGWFGQGDRKAEPGVIYRVALKSVSAQMTLLRGSSKCNRNWRCLNKAGLNVCWFLIVEKLTFYRHKTNTRTHITFIPYNRPDSVYKTIWPHVRQIPEVVHPYVPLSVFALHNTTKTERLKPHVCLTRIAHTKYKRNVKYARERAKTKRKTARANAWRWEENQKRVKHTRLTHTQQI